MEPYTILEVHSGKLVDSVHDCVFIARVSYTKADKTTFDGRMMIPPRVFPTDGVKDVQDTLPLLMVYLGKKAMEKEGHSCFDLRPVSIPSDRTLVDYAEELRRMTPEKLSALFRIDSFGEFPEGTVFICESVRQIKRETKDEIGLSKETRVPVMKYETVLDDVRKNGEIFLPNRTYTEVKKNIPAVLIFNGLKKTKKGGRTYFDITVMDETMSSTLAKSAAAAAAATSDGTTSGNSHTTSVPPKKVDNNDEDGDDDNNDDDDDDDDDFIDYELAYYEDYPNPMYISPPPSPAHSDTNLV